MKSRHRWLLGALLIWVSVPAGRATCQTAELTELRQRQAATFNSAGHPKANGLEISLNYPRSWRVTEGARPHVVQNFTATNAPVNCNLLIREMGPAMTEAGLRAYIQPGQAGTQAPLNSERVSSLATTIGELPATQLVFESTSSRAGQTINAKMIIFITAFRTSVIQLTCAAGGADQPAAAARFDAYEPVFRLVANSLVVHDLYR